MGLTHEVLPGGLSDADRERIFDLAEKGQKPGQIARRLLKHPSTVYWFMLTEGLAAPRPAKSFTPYLRNGRMVRPYSPDEDAFIEALRIQNYSVGEIARIANLRFKNERTPHGVNVRLVMLAAREAA